MTQHHFKDLTKIDVLFGDLDDDTAARLFVAARNGGPIEKFKIGVGFTRKTGTLYFFNPTVTYRLAPQPVTYDSTDWAHVADGWNFCARDKNGEHWFYENEPVQEGVRWVSSGGDAARATHKVTRGTCDWTDSLMVRPGHERKDT
jgi:hypothetical protein